MTDSIYRVTEVIGTSSQSWEEAAKNAVETAARTVRDLRVGEIVKLDLTHRRRSRGAVPRPGQHLVQVRRLTDVPLGAI